MKKVSEVAKELGVTRQTVYYWIDKKSETLTEHIDSKGNAKVIDEQGIKIIQQAIEGVKETDKETNRAEEHYKRRIELLEERIDFLKEQIERKDELIREQSEQLRNFQVLLRERKEEINKLEGETVDRSSSVWSRIKNIFTR